MEIDNGKFQRSETTNIKATKNNNARTINSSGDAHAGLRLANGYAGYWSTETPDTGLYAKIVLIENYVLLYHPINHHLIIMN